MTAEQAQQRIAALEAELERVRLAASQDVQNLQTDVVAKNREIARLRGEINRQLEESPEADTARRLLKLWHEVHKNGRANVDITLDGDRGRATLRKLKTLKTVGTRTPEERIRRAIIGATFDEWAMGRTSKQTRPYNDLAKHILADADRFEFFEDLYAKHCPDDPSVDEGKPQLRLAPESARPLPDYGRRPIDRVLDALPDGFRESTTQHCWMARCPAHDDRDPSLSIRVEDGMDGEIVLLNCFAGCKTDDVVEALGLGMADLFASRIELESHRPRRQRPADAIPLHLRRAMKQLLGDGEAA